MKSFIISSFSYSSGIIKLSLHLQIAIHKYNNIMLVIVKMYFLEKGKLFISILVKFLTVLLVRLKKQKGQEPLMQIPVPSPKVQKNSETK